MQLTQELTGHGRRVRWERHGTGPAVVFCHGTPWSSWLWAPYASAFGDRFSTYLWDMPGYGVSSKDPEHSGALGVQGELLHDLLEHWELEAPEIVAHDYGGSVAPAGRRRRSSDPARSADPAGHAPSGLAHRSGTHGCLTHRSSGVAQPRGSPTTRSRPACLAS